MIRFYVSFFCICGFVVAEVRLPKFLASHMVLQRGQPRLWGWADPGVNLTVSLLNTTVFTIADSKGSWTVELPPQKAGAGHVIDIISEADPAIRLEDVAFGDVYLCSGQSNMEMSVGAVFNSSQEIADSINYPNLRLFTAARAVSDSPEMDLQSKASYSWARSGPAAMDASGSFSWYSATCYFYGRDLYRRLDGAIPIGLVTSSWGGQKVEAFSSPDALADVTCGGTRAPEPENSYYHPSNVVNGEEEETDGPQATQLWNAMIHPFIPMRVAGVVWYQGEANYNDPSSYSCRFPAMIADWRVKLNLPNLTFLYVQLAAFERLDYTGIRAAQDAALQLPRVGRATASDLGDPTSPIGPVHPRCKQEIGQRLSLVGHAMHYPQSGLVWEGPVLKSVRLPTSASQYATTYVAVLEFRPGTEHGLRFNGTAACQDCCSDPPFQVLDRSGTWRTALQFAVVSHRKVVLEARAPILGIRYDWQAYPQCALYNSDLLPAAPFEWCVHWSGHAAWTEHGACSVELTVSSVR